MSFDANRLNELVGCFNDLGASGYPARVVPRKRMREVLDSRGSTRLGHATETPLNLDYGGATVSYNGFQDRHPIIAQEA
jgi:hypothetical protein